jgi:hypothetical protein
VTVALSTSERSLIRSRGGALVMTRENGKSKLGPRSSQRLLPLAK